MNITNLTNSIQHLRLVRPTESTGQIRSVNAVANTENTQSTSLRVDRNDAYSFEAVYRARLPRIKLTDAHRRLERIRNQLVAARTDVPIHFDEVKQAGMASPLTNAYLSFKPGDADVNAAATEQRYHSL